MNAGKSESWKWFLAAGALLALLMGAVGCGGGGGTTTATVPTATIQGSVSGTIIMAIDETGFIAARDDTSGKTPLPGSSPPKYPFTLNVPVGHQYTIQFIVGEGTSEERMVPLFEDTVNIFSVSSTGILDLGYVDTSGAAAASDNNILMQPGVTSGGTTGDNTIKLEGYRYLNYRNDRDGTISLRFHVEVRNPGGTAPITNKSLIRNVAFYDNNWNELALSGGFFLWNGTERYSDPPSPPALNPSSDIEATLVKAPSELAEGFYNMVAIDNAGNLHKAKVYFRQPDTVAKPGNLSETVNPDNSIKLTWVNPDLSGGQYFVLLAVTQDDLDGDGIVDILLHARKDPPSTFTSYTIPADFVASNLKGKSNLKWHIEIRQYDDTIVFPDGSTPGIGTQFYRNYSADSSLRLPGEPLGFTPDMLKGKIFYSDFVESAGFVANLLFFNDDGSLRTDLTDNKGTETLTGSWSINDAGQGIANIQGVISTVTLLSDSSTGMKVSVVEGNLPPQEQVLQKTVPIVVSKILGSYGVDYGLLTDVLTFNSDGTGTSLVYESFNWEVAGAKLFIDWVAAGGSSTESYALASSESTDTAYTTLRMGAKDIGGDGAVIGVYPWTLTRQGPLSAGISLSAAGELLPLPGTNQVEIPMMSSPTFYARVSGGTGVYTYNWSLSNTTIFIPEPDATKSTYSMMVSGGVTWEATLKLTVTDSKNNKSEKTITLHTTGTPVL